MRCFTWVLLSFLFTSSAQAFSGAKKLTSSSDNPDPLRPGQVLLSAAIRDKVVGTQMDDAALQEKLAKQADEFITLSRLRKGHSQREAFVDRCQANEGKVANENPFCALMEDLESRKRAGKERHYLNRATVRMIGRELLKGKIDGLDKASEHELLAAMKKIPESKSLQKAMRAALEVGPCPTTAILTSLGMRAELNFPQQEYKDLAVELYSRSIACGEDLSTLRAAYRLGLIRIWEGNYAEADRILTPVSEHPLAIDFRQRALYWRYYSAAGLKNPELQQEMQARLIREYPLSLHALFVGGGPGQAEQKILNSRDPALSLRSVSKTAVNPVLAAAEILQSKGEAQSAADLIELNYDSLKEAELPVQLYASVILMRSGEVLRKFKLMASIFHDNPSLISASTLEMLYPLQRFDIIRSFESVIDPYMVIALIRQESAFNERARSGAGALGLMQLMPHTARKIERKISRRELLKPEVNVRLGVKFFSKLLENYNGDAELALAAYNAGSDRVGDWLVRYPVQNRLLFIDMMPFRETREYVASIARNYFWYLKLYNPEAFRNRIPATKVDGVTPPRFSVFNFFQLPEVPKTAPSGSYSQN